MVKNPVTKRKEAFWAIKDISFELEKGSSLGLIGANGSGKSTLLKIISRIVTPTTGTIKTTGTLAPLLDLEAGFHGELTGRENTNVYASLIGIKRKELKQRFDDIIDFAEIGAFVDTKLRSYSSGMKMRLAFSIASTLQPDIILADEILSVGDEEFQKRCLERILDLKARGTIIIMVQHDNELIKKICDRTVSLEKRG